MDTTTTTSAEALRARVLTNIRPTALARARIRGGGPGRICVGVFLEINPNGQWGWIEEHTGLPITSAMADLLTGEAVE